MLSESMQVFGLGQAGNRIGKEFAAVGFNTSYVNSDEVDIRGMDIPEDDLFLVATTGTGASLAKGKVLVDDHIESFSKFLISKMDKTKLQLFIAGLGGGTGGSFIVPAIKIAKEHGFRTGVLVTLPEIMKGPLGADNALRTLKELKKQDINTFILADNEFLIKNVGLSANWWQRVNTYIIRTVTSSLELLKSGRISHKGIGSIDKGEILRILQSGKGCTDIRTIYFNASELSRMEDSDLMKKLFEPSLVSGYNYSTTLSYLVSVDVPPRGNYTEDSYRIFNVTKKKCGSSMSRLGMFTDPLLTDTIKVTMINSGLKLPKTLQVRINNLKRDEQRYMDKKEKADTLDFSDLGESFLEDDFDL